VPREGRPPKPVEEHRRLGTYRPDRHGAPQVWLQAAVELPEAAGGLGEAGTAFWNAIWRDARTWLTPKLDRVMLENGGP